MANTDFLTYDVFDGMNTTALAATVQTLRWIADRTDNDVRQALLNQLDRAETVLAAKQATTAWLETLRNY